MVRKDVALNPNLGLSRRRPSVLPPSSTNFLGVPLPVFPLDPPAGPARSTGGAVAPQRTTKPARRSLLLNPPGVKTPLVKGRVIDVTTPSTSILNPDFALAMAFVQDPIGFAMRQGSTPKVRRSMPPEDDPLYRQALRESGRKAAHGDVTLPGQPVKTTAPFPDHFAEAHGFTWKSFMKGVDDPAQGVDLRNGGKIPFDRALKRYVAVTGKSSVQGTMNDTARGLRGDEYAAERDVARTGALRAHTNFLGRSIDAMKAGDPSAAKGAMVNGLVGGGVDRIFESAGHAADLLTNGQMDSILDNLTTTTGAKLSPREKSTAMSLYGRTATGIVGAAAAPLMLGDATLSGLKNASTAADSTASPEERRSAGLGLGMDALLFGAGPLVAKGISGVGKSRSGSALTSGLAKVRDGVNKNIRWRLGMNPGEDPFPMKTENGLNAPNMPFEYNYLREGIGGESPEASKMIINRDFIGDEANTAINRRHEGYHVATGIRDPIEPTPPPDATPKQVAKMRDRWVDKMNSVQGRRDWNDRIYDHEFSDFIRGTDETLAEWYATGSLKKGIRHAFQEKPNAPGEYYYANPLHAGAEAVAGGATLAALLLSLNRAGNLWGNAAYGDPDAEVWSPSLPIPNRKGSRVREVRPPSGNSPVRWPSSSWDPRRGF